MESEVLKIERDPPVGRIIFNRPEKLNAMYRSTAYELPQAIDELAADDDVRVIIMKGAGRAWSVGMDFNVISPKRGKIEKGKVAGHIDAAREMLEGRERLAGLFKIWDCPKPVIAQLHGYAGGWATLPIVFCDLRYAAPDFSMFYAAGQTGAFLGEVWSLLIGLAAAKEYYWRAPHQLTAVELERLGVINRIYPADELEETVESIAREIAQMDPLFLRLQKLGLNRMWDRMGFREAVLGAKDIDVMLHHSVPGVANFERLRELGGDRRRMAEEQARGDSYWDDMRGDKK